MAGTWRIYDDLRTTYQNPDAEDGRVQPCGKAEDSNLNEVVGWAALQGNAGDYICTGKGVFFVQAAAAC